MAAVAWIAEAGAALAATAGAQMPAAAAAFLDALCDAAATDEQPRSLDYVRLNLEAAMPRGGA